MRRFLLVAPFIVLGMGCTILLIVVYLANSSPLLPEQVLFPLQQSAEKLKISLINNRIERFEYTLGLLKIRTESLDALAGSQAEITALEALSQSLDQADAALNRLPENQKNYVQPRFAKVLDFSIRSLNTLSYSRQHAPETYNSVLNRASIIQTIATEFKKIQRKQFPKNLGIALLPFVSNAVGQFAQSPSPEADFSPQTVIFPPGSPGAEHGFFPLTGKHAILECTSCHTGGNFSGTSQLCSTCHEDVKPASHFSGECSVCHSTNAWRPANFDHSGQTNCQSCHLRNKPSNHYGGQCSMCHNSNAWKPARFNHSGQTNCQSCHNRPSGHYTGQCSACHTTNAWRPARFNHSGQTNCQSCHNRPSGHYSGQCSACHTTNAWRPASFNHSGQTNCQSCHNRPSGHYTGQCSACHTTNAWRPASFNHNGQTDCQSCHSRPNNHWNGQCSQCHNNNSWGSVQVNGHTFPINHKNANGVCSRCHPSDTPAYTCYNCHNRAETENHHAEKDIFNIANRCADCHPNGKSD